ncbi:hypothetical protein NCAS_0A12790 [Naumovozyma castellii]|uniref:Peroxisome assembly protein 12 n=1 Tax=Naumovozyma castellii TaxID=27288 RepID=G0V8N8_NAUCA|nr:hypothetical protein NCAS_0A12790 [Naumovozyma castellii CBS 4309]CCC67837.1 hypothetical protein NCAS_0A12790 [Naumovozyma castellii CBS 4309]
MSFYSNLPTTSNELSASTIYPTIFEILSSQELDALFPASIRYLLTNYWISRFPSWTTLQVNNYFDEWFNLLIKGLVEAYHLKNFNTTFIDKFYGLQRFSTRDQALLKAQIQSLQNGKAKSWPLELQLTKEQRMVIFLQKIILPYIKNNLDDIHRKIVTESAFGSRPEEEKPSILAKIKLLLKAVIQKYYPTFKRICFLLNMTTRLSFLMGKNASMSFLDYCFNIGYMRMVLPLQKKQLYGYGSTKDKVLRLKRVLGQNKMAQLNKLRHVLSQTAVVGSYAGSQLFPSFVFGLRVYQWWVTEDLSAKLQKKIDTMDEKIPRPPNKSSLEVSSSETCPVCQLTVQNPCVLETGYVTCYPCAIKYITKHEGRCPVTNKKLLGCKYDEVTQSWRVTNGLRKLLI